MAFKNDLKNFILVVFGISQIAATNIDCNGKAFHCVNTTHFMICVDLGGGVSKTVDDFVIPCPPTTGCLANNRFECEYLTVPTTAATVSNSEVNYNVTESATSPDWEQIVVTSNELKANEIELLEKYYDTLNESTPTGDIVTINENAEPTASESNFQTSEISLGAESDTSTLRNTMVTENLVTMTIDTDLNVEKNAHITTLAFTSDGREHSTVSSLTATGGNFFNTDKKTENIETASTEPYLSTNDLVTQEGLTEKYDKLSNTVSGLNIVPVSDAVLTTTDAISTISFTEMKYNEEISTQVISEVPENAINTTELILPSSVSVDINLDVGKVTEGNLTDNISVLEVETSYAAVNFFTTESPTTLNTINSGIESTSTSDINIIENIEPSVGESNFQTSKLSFSAVDDTSTIRNNIVTENFETLTPSLALNTLNTDLHVEENTDLITRVDLTTIENIFTVGDTTEHFETPSTESYLYTKNLVTQEVFIDKFDQLSKTESRLNIEPLPEEVSTTTDALSTIGLTKIDDYEEVPTPVIPEHPTTDINTIELIIPKVIATDSPKTSSTLNTGFESTKVSDIVIMNENAEPTVSESNFQTAEISFGAVHDTSTIRNNIVTENLETLTPSLALNTLNTDLHVEKNTDLITRVDLTTIEPKHSTTGGENIFTIGDTTEHFETLSTEPYLYTKKLVTQEVFMDKFDQISKTGLNTVPITEDVSMTTDALSTIGFTKIDDYEEVLTPVIPELLTTDINTKELIIPNIITTANPKTSSTLNSGFESTQASDIVIMNENAEPTISEFNFQMTEISFSAVHDTSTLGNNILTENLVTLTPSLALHNTDLHIGQNTNITTVDVTTEEPDHPTVNIFTTTGGENIVTVSDKIEHFETPSTEPYLYPNNLVTQEVLTEKYDDQLSKTRTGLNKVPLTEKISTTTETISTIGFTENEDYGEVPTQVMSEVPTDDVNTIELMLPSLTTLTDINLDDRKFTEGNSIDNSWLLEQETNNAAVNTIKTASPETSSTPNSGFESTQASDIVIMNENAEPTVSESDFPTPEISVIAVHGSSTLGNNIVTENLVTLTRSLDKHTNITTVDDVTTEEPEHSKVNIFTTGAENFLTVGDTTEHFETPSTEPYLYTNNLATQELLTEKYDQLSQTESELYTVPVKYEVSTTTDAISTRGFKKMEDYEEVTTKVILEVPTSDINTKEFMLPSLASTNTNLYMGKIKEGVNVFTTESQKAFITLKTGVEEQADTKQITWDKFVSETKNTTEKINADVLPPSLITNSNKENIDRIDLDSATMSVATTETNYDNNGKGLNSNGEYSASTTFLTSGNVSSDVVTEEISYTSTENGKLSSVSLPLSTDISSATNSVESNENQTIFTTPIANEVINIELISEPHVQTEIQSSFFITDVHGNTAIDENLTTIDSSLKVDMSPYENERISSTTSLNNGVELIVETTVNFPLENKVTQDTQSKDTFNKPSTLDEFSYTNHKYFTEALNFDETNTSSQITTTPTLEAAYQNNNFITSEGYNSVNVTQAVDVSEISNYLISDTTEQISLEGENPSMTFVPTEYALPNKLGNFSKQDNASKKYLNNTKNHNQKDNFEIELNQNANESLALSDNTNTVDYIKFSTDVSPPKETNSFSHFGEQNDTNPLKDLILNSAQLKEDESYSSVATSTITQNKENYTPVPTANQTVPTLNSVVQNTESVTSLLSELNKDKLHISGTVETKTGPVQERKESTNLFAKPPLQTNPTFETLSSGSVQEVEQSKIESSTQPPAQITPSYADESLSNDQQEQENLNTAPILSTDSKTLSYELTSTGPVQEKRESANIFAKLPVPTNPTMRLSTPGSIQTEDLSETGSPTVATAQTTPNLAYESLSYVQEEVEVKSNNFEHEHSNPAQGELKSTVLSSTGQTSAYSSTNQADVKFTSPSSLVSHVSETLSLRPETKEFTMDLLVEEENKTTKKSPVTLTNPRTTFLHTTAGLMLDEESFTELYAEPGSTSKPLISSNLVQRESESTFASPLTSTQSSIAKAASTVPKTFSFSTSVVQESTETTTASVVSTVKKVRPFTCVNRYRGRYADQEDCRRFYVCIGRVQPIAGSCPVNTVFSELKKQCTKNLSHCMRYRNFQCIKDGRFVDIYSDNIYYICVQSEMGKFYRFKFQCEIGYHLNNTSMKCVENKVTLNNLRINIDISKSESDKSFSTSNKSKESKIEKDEKEPFECEKEGKFHHPEDCRKYYECKKKKSEYRRKIKKCDSDELFHKKKKKCVDADSYEC